MNLSKIAMVAISMLVPCALACSAASESGSDESDPEGLSVGSTHFDFDASKLAGPSGPAYFSQLRPSASEMLDVMCPGPSYTPTERIYDSNKVAFTGSAGSCDGKYKTDVNGQIVIYCATTIQKHVCP